MHSFIHAFSGSQVLPPKYTHYESALAGVSWGDNGEPGTNPVLQGLRGSERKESNPAMMSIQGRKR